MRLKPPKHQCGPTPTPDGPFKLVDAGRELLVHVIRAVPIPGSGEAAAG